MNLVQSLTAWAQHGSYVVTGTHIQLRERDQYQSAAIRKVVAMRQDRMDRSYAGAVIASFWRTFAWLDAVDLHFIVQGGEDRIVLSQPIGPVPVAGAPLPLAVTSDMSTFDRNQAVGVLAAWWMDQDLYQVLSSEPESRDLSIRLRRSDVAQLLKQSEVHGMAVYQAVHKAGRIQWAGPEPMYALAKHLSEEPGHA